MSPQHHIKLRAFCQSPSTLFPVEFKRGKLYYWTLQREGIKYLCSKNAPRCTLNCNTKREEKVLTERVGNKLGPRDGTLPVLFIAALVESAN